MKKVLMLSDSPTTNTGYSSQTLFLLNELNARGYDCYLMAHNYYGQTMNKGNIKLNDGTPFNFTMYGGGREPYCKDLIMRRIREIKPDYFIILLDTFMLYPWILNMDFAPAKSFFWFPSDGGRFPHGCDNVLRKINIPVAMARFGQKQVKDLYGINSYHIPHGIYSERFYPLDADKKAELKKKWGLSNKYVVGIMGRNQGRKMHDRALKAFKKFCVDKPDAILLCHLDPEDGAAVFDIFGLIRDYGLENRVRFTGTRYFDGFTYEQMNEVYNLMDVYFSSSSGEGFGIGTIEAMSCGVPCVVTNYTTTEELVVENNAGVGVCLVGCDDISFFKTHTKKFDEEVMNGTLTGSWDVERGLMDINDAANKLSLLYANADDRHILGLNGREAVLKKYDWTVVADMWDKLLRGRE